jgi:hypothetical protein
MGQTAMVISAIAGAVGTAASINQQKKAAALQQRQSELQNRRSQRQAIREAQIRRAQAVSSSVAGGSNLGSGIAGGISSLGSQVGETLGFSSQYSGLSKQINLATQRANTFSSIGKFGFGLFDSLSGGQGFSALFPARQSASNQPQARPRSEGF